MTLINDTALVVRDYSDPNRLAERFRAWREFHKPDLPSAVIEAVAALQPESILEVGCGDGQLGMRLSELPNASYQGLEFAPAMAAQAALRGLGISVGDVQSMPFPDDSYDVVVASWMLYHVPDLDRALQEIVRVLRPGGKLVATTMGHRHMRELWDRVDDVDTAPKLSFHADNATKVLQRHFDTVEARSLAGQVTFPDYASVIAHIKSTLTRAHLADELPPFDGPLIASSSNAMFIATAAS